MKRTSLIIVFLLLTSILLASSVAADGLTETLTLTKSGSDTPYDTTSGVFYRSYNYAGFPNGYAKIMSYPTGSAATKNIWVRLRVKDGGTWKAAGANAWIQPAVGSFKALPIYAAYRDDPDLSFKLRARLNTDELDGTYPIFSEKAR